MQNNRKTETEKNILCILTFVIMERLEEVGIPFEVDGIKLNSLWFCDDSSLIANSVASAITNIRIVREVSRDLGLEINEDFFQIGI